MMAFQREDRSYGSGSVNYPDLQEKADPQQRKGRGLEAMAWNETKGLCLLQQVLQPWDISNSMTMRAVPVQPMLTVNTNDLCIQ